MSTEKTDEVGELFQAAADARDAADSVVRDAVDAPDRLRARIIDDNVDTPGWWVLVEAVEPEQSGEYVVYVSDDHSEATLYSLAQHMKAAPATESDNDQKHDMSKLRPEDFSAEDVASLNAEAVSSVAQELPEGKTVGELFTEEQLDRMFRSSVARWLTSRGYEDSPENIEAAKEAMWRDAEHGTGQ